MFVIEIAEIRLHVCAFGFFILRAWTFDDGQIGAADKSFDFFFSRVNERSNHGQLFARQIGYGREARKVPLEEQIQHRSDYGVVVVVTQRELVSSKFFNRIV